jgi:hypothetical protein
MGANMAFRREAILAAGGCDEMYTYHFEDADLSVAVIQAGYRIQHHPRALVHHFPATSHNRRSPFDLNYFALARGQLYFSLKFSRRPALSCLKAVGNTKREWLRLYRHLVWQRRMTPWAALRYTAMAVRGLASGYKHGLHYRKHGRVPAVTARPAAAGVPPDRGGPRAGRPPRRTHGLRVALICGHFGGHFGGVEGYSQHLAESLADRGHDVTVLRSGMTTCRVRPDGYKIVDVPHHDDPAICRALYLFELRQLAARRDFDIVEAPLFEGRGMAIGAAARWPLVVRLQTPFEVIRQISGLPLDPHVTAAIAAERMQLAYAAGVISISRAVVDTVEADV